MAPTHLPTYEFDFGGGISAEGTFWRREQNGEPQLWEQLHYCLDDSGLVAGLGVRHSDTSADLVDIGVAVYYADRCSPREGVTGQRDSGDRWRRHIKIAIPVRRLDVWAAPETMDKLQDLLWRLTDDEWEINVTQRLTDVRAAEGQLHAFAPSLQHPAVILFSGGLDSLAGLVDFLGRVEFGTLIPITVVTHSHIEAAASNVLRHIRTTEGIGTRDTRWVRCKTHRRRKAQHDKKEPSQRARAFLFLAVAIATATSIGSDRVFVCENGPGAISLPMTVDHYGARATKAMHPRTLSEFSQLASRVFNRSIQIDNLGLWKTKGELCANSWLDPFADAAALTVSCDRATYHLACGKCSSCIVRRMAVAAVPFASDFTEYRFDLTSRSANWSSENTGHLVAMRTQYEKLTRSLGSHAEFADLRAAFSELSEVTREAQYLGLTSTEIEARVLRLYQRYASEFQTFMGHVDRPDWGHVSELYEFDPIKVAAQVS